MAKPTVYDIASEAGVSLATVDRVLNARPGVREKTVCRVNEAVKKLGYVRDLSAANLARQRQYRFVFILPESESQFVASLKEAINEVVKILPTDRTNIKIQHAPANDPHAVVQLLNRLDRSKVDGVAVMAPETPQLRDAILRLKSQGISVVALVSDLPNSEVDHFVGINNKAAGRTAGVLLGRFSAQKQGKVLIIADSMQSRDSLERRLGFDEVMAEQFPELTVLPSLETYGDAERGERIVKMALATQSQIRGVYLLGSGIQVVVNTLSSSRAIDGLIVLAHELTPFTRSALKDHLVDAVITQDVGHLVRSSIRVLQAKSDGIQTIPSQERIRTEIILKENLP